jgi:hypothetical protein
MEVFIFISIEIIQNQFIYGFISNIWETMILCKLDSIIDWLS